MLPRVIRETRPRLAWKAVMLACDRPPCGRRWWETALPRLCSTLLLWSSRTACTTCFGEVSKSLWPSFATAVQALPSIQCEVLVTVSPRPETTLVGPVLCAVCAIVLTPQVNNVRLTLNALTSNVTSSRRVATWRQKPFLPTTFFSDNTIVKA